jgi:hypothetical protein
MKLASLFATFALGSFGVVASLATIATADDDPAKNVTIEAKRDAGKVTIKIKPADHWYVNSEYPLKCSLKIADGGTLEKAELKKEDGQYTDAGKPGKAKDVTFKTGADKAVSGECKMVLCSDNSCSSPFKVPVQSN